MGHPLPARLATAEDVMTQPVVSVTPEATVREVAALLLHHRISAVPVLDATGAPIGIVSEGDLLGRSAEDRLAGHEWWLAILQQPGQADAAVTEAATARLVADVMHGPVVTVGTDTPVRDVALLLRAQGIKRAPVMRGNRMVGIVSRADLLRAIEGDAAPHEPPQQGMLISMIAGLFAGTGSAPVPAPRAAATAVPPKITADDFRALVEASDEGKAEEKTAMAHTAELDRARQVKAMLQDHVGAEMWSTLLNHARVAAAHGAKEIELLRFPAGLCTDSGRKINNADPAWADTLQGEASEMYQRWESDLKPKGFELVSRVVGFTPHGPGDLALVLVWEF